MSKTIDLPQRLLRAPSEGTRYYHVGSEGIIRYSNWHGDSLDQARLMFGNVFPDRQSAIIAKTHLEQLLKAME